MSAYKRRHALDVGDQFMQLRSAGFEGWSGKLRRGELECAFWCRPSPASGLYRLRLKYKRGDKPKVYVVAPDLFELSSGRTPPHLFGPKVHPAYLCLYRASKGEWNSSMSLRTTVVPWAAEWLFNFELWLATDQWHGGGEHPESEAWPSVREAVNV